LTWLSQYFASREFGQIEIANRVKSGSIESSPSDVKQASLASKLQAAPQTVHQNGMSHVISKLKFLEQFTTTKIPKGDSAHLLNCENQIRHPFKPVPDVNLKSLNPLARQVFSPAVSLVTERLSDLCLTEFLMMHFGKKPLGQV
jgi:hypothetical protein